MNPHMSLLARALAGLVLLSILELEAAPPAAIAHQGRIIVSGTNYDGSGYFKFALVDATGTTTLWSNDGSSTGGGQPTNAVPVTVSKGLYSVPLGDTTFDAQMNTPVPASVLGANDDVRLRIWFSTDNSTFEQLSPDQRLLSAPYALNAQQAQSVGSGAITADMLSTTAVQDSIEASGQLGIGREGDPVEAHLHLGSHPVVSEIQDGQGGFTQLSGAVDVFVSGNTAYVASFGDDSLTIIDVTDPKAPVLLAELKDNVGEFDSLDGANSVFVSGNTAYVASLFDDSLTIIDVSNPAAPSLLSSIDDLDTGFENLTGASTVMVFGSTAYVGGSDGVTIIDVSNPAAPAYLGEINSLGSVDALDVEGPYLYFSESFGNFAIGIANVADSTTPIVVSRLSNSNGFSKLIQVENLQVEGSLLYATAVSSNALTIADVQDPLNPVLVNEIADSSDGINLLDGAYSVVLNGMIAYVTAYYDGSLTVLDLTDPLAPILLAEHVDDVGGFNLLYQPGHLFLDGTILYVTSIGDNGLSIIDTTKLLQNDLLVSHRMGIGTSSPQSALHVEGDAFVSGSFLDSSRNSGSYGQYLSSTRTGTDWRDLPDNSPTNEVQSISFSGVTDTLSISAAGGISPNPVTLGKFLNDDGSEALDGDLVVTNTVTATAYSYPSAQTHSFQIPGNAMLPSSNSEDFFRSALGYIRPAGADTRFIATAPVHLPQGAVIQGYYIYYYDNSTIAQWTDFTTRLRQRVMFGSDAENIASFDLTPFDFASTLIVVGGVQVPTAERPTVDNENYSYWVTLDCSVSAVDSELRFFGFEILYTIQELQP